MADLTPAHDAAPETTGEFNERSARAALAEASAAVRFDPAGAELIRLGENAVFRLRSGDVVARVGRSAGKAPEVSRQLAVARWLASKDVPAVRVADVEQPVVVGDRIVAFWETVGDDPQYGSTSDLGRILQHLHELEVPASIELPKLSPFDATRARLDVVPISEADRRYLSDRADELQQAFARLRFDSPDVVLHGDANVGNLLVDSAGQAVLSDLDSFCVGPREWDLVLTAMFYSRFGWHTRQEYEAFLEAYGYDILQWDGFEAMADVRELLMVVWLAQNVGGSANAEEFSRRMETLRRDAPRSDWRPF